MNDNDRAVVLSRLDGTRLPERLWTYDDFAAAEERPGDFGPGLVSLAFIRAAIRRSRRFWCALAVVGLLLGSGVYISLPPDYQASASVLLTFGPYENSTTAATDDQVIAESRAVAGLAVHKLGLNENAASFVSSYTASAVSTRVLLITANAPSSSEAVRWANAVAAAFLQFHARELQTQQRLILGALQGQVSQAKQRVKSVTSQISQLRAQPASPAQQARLSKLEQERIQLAATLYTTQQSANGSQAQAATALAVKGSSVLDAAAPVRHSRLKTLLLYPAAGLFIGFILGLAIVVVRALVSDRLHRRDDIARALGAPVKISVGDVRGGRLLPGGRRRPAAHDAGIRRIAAHLRDAAHLRRRRPATLAVVPIGDPRVAAESVVSLAVACAHEGRQVVVADLCPGTPAARLLGSPDPGVRTVTIGESTVIAAVPDADEVAPTGPFGPGPAAARNSPFAAALAAACESAEYLLTLTAVDPALGAEHLATWAADAVAVVTAGESSVSRVHAVGEMIRLADMRLLSAVLVAADKTDESVGTLADAAWPPVMANGNS